MSRLNVNIAGQLRGAGATQQLSRLQIVNREPFSPITSFFLGMSSGVTAAISVFYILLNH